jgi:hypothetical protein
MTQNEKRIEEIGNEIKRLTKLQDDAREPTILEVAALFNETEETVNSDTDLQLTFSSFITQAATDFQDYYSAQIAALKTELEEISHVPPYIKWFDQGTVEDGDLFEVSSVYEVYAFETYEVLFDPADVNVDRIVVGVYAWDEDTTMFVKQ